MKKLLTTARLFVVTAIATDSFKHQVNGPSSF
jgi:hypothetical protein